MRSYFIAHFTLLREKRPHQPGTYTHKHETSEETQCDKHGKIMPLVVSLSICPEGKMFCLSFYLFFI